MTISKNTKKIDGVHLRVDMLELEEAEECFVRAVKALGPALGELAKAAIAAKTSSVLDVDVAVAGGAFAQLAANLTKEDLTYFRKVFADVTYHEAAPGKWIKFVPEVVLKGKFGVLLKWLRFALEVNFADFLSGVSATSGRPSSDQASVESPSESPQG